MIFFKIYFGQIIVFFNKMNMSNTIIYKKFILNNIYQIKIFHYFPLNFNKRLLLSKQIVSFFSEPTF